jgi:hypothetical protein
MSQKNVDLIGIATGSMESRMPIYCLYIRVNGNALESMLRSVSRSEHIPAILQSIQLSKIFTEIKLLA